MLCTVYNDGANNGTYQLAYNHATNNLTDNNNWVPYNPSSTNGGNTEWLNSVISIIATPPNFPNNGDRYLIDSTAFGLFVGNENKIIQWDSVLGGFWWMGLLSPTNGTTIRLDSNSNFIYKYVGTYSTGKWYKEYLNQVRYINPTSTNGLTYSYTSSGVTPLDDYDYSIYVCNFNATNSGTVSLQIDGLGYKEIKKFSNNSLVSLLSGDLVPGVDYQLGYNNGYFQTFLSNSILKFATGLITFTRSQTQTLTHNLGTSTYMIHMYDSTGDQILGQYRNRTINTVDVTTSITVTASVVIIG
jgi:hypothetical protein